MDVPWGLPSRLQSFWTRFTGATKVLVPLCLDLGGEKSWPWVLAGFPRIMRMARRMLLQLEAWLWTKHDSGADSLLNAFNGLLTLHQL